jgi:hypothetical protein
MGFPNRRKPARFCMVVSCRSMGLNDVRQCICSLRACSLCACICSLCVRPLLGSYRCCGLPAVLYAWGQISFLQQTHAAIGAFKFFEQQIFISWVCVSAMTTLRTNKPFAIHPLSRRHSPLPFINSRCRHATEADLLQDRQTKACNTSRREGRAAARRGLFATPVDATMQQDIYATRTCAAKACATEVHL